jgi:GPH family glycoside/pentoside/hexuronide:cation symporter
MNAPATDEKAALPWSQRIRYGLGNAASLTTGYGIGSLANYVFNLALGVNPALVGLAQAIPRLVDLVTDPVAGYLSDTLKPRYGRTRLIALGTLLSALFFAAVWWFPTGLSATGYFTWLLVFSCLTYVGWWLLSVPWQAMGFELAATAHERTKLMAVATFFGGLAGIGYGWTYAATQLPLFRDTVHGARWVGAAMALVILVCGLVCAWGCREPRATTATTANKHAAHGSVRDFFHAFARVRANRPFWPLMGGVVAMCVGTFSIGSFSPYLAIYYVKPGDAAGAAWLIGAASTAWQGTSLLLAGVVSAVAARLGKHRALQAFLALALLGNFAKWFCYSPALPWLYIIPAACFAAGFTALWTLVPSLTADIAEAERHRTGSTDEGMFAGVYVWMIKFGSTLAFAAAGFLLNLTGFDVAHGTQQPAAAIWWMRMLDVVIPSVAVIVAIMLIQVSATKSRSDNNSA